MSNIIGLSAILDRIEHALNSSAHANVINDFNQVINVIVEFLNVILRDGSIDELEYSRFTFSITHIERMLYRIDKMMLESPVLDQYIKQKIRYQFAVKAICSCHSTLKSMGG